MDKRIYIQELSDKKGENVMLQGWVNAFRNQGKMIFLDFRDKTGIVQGVILPGSSAMEIGSTLREEFVVEVLGKVNPRPEKNIKVEVLNGDIELEVLDIKILNSCQVLPFPITEDTSIINEPLRLKYRYLDLRSSRLQKNIKNRFKIQNFIRNYLTEQDFIEVETPLLSAPTLEGSRSFVVPSRLYNGDFFSLPQSPQQYKQLLMVAGVEKYFQFARCMRDEDARGDRQPEFTQLDLEMSFTSEEEVMKLNEDILIELVTKFYPEKKIQQIPFPKITYQEVMKKYGTDKPDIREDKNDPNLLAFLWVVDFPMFKKVDENNVDELKEWTYTHNPFSSPRAEYFSNFTQKKDIANIIATQYDLVLNGYEIGGGSLRNHRAQDLQTTFEIMGYNSERIENNFGHILQALDFGAPPHGGIAWGFDRLLMVLENESSIREVIPFSKTSDGKDLTMNAPSK
ncbi:MAG: OB-fold nucleic acid binding domain-containing protein, partial [Patescibacteria group bacterium]|nr:OB-fold nucleic acid binding domain-containing protein [Patescibacteria group bacterium]